MSQPTILIIGAMKCGTTSLFEWLARHPRICPCRVKEPEYFSRHQEHRLPVDCYDDLFDCSPDTKFRLEASTGYSKYPEEKGVPARIQAELGQPKLIYLLRDPFDRIESHFNHLQGQFQGRKDTDILADTYLYLSQYAMQLDQYVQVFGREALLLLELRELQRSPQAVLNRCYRFLGLRPPWRDRFPWPRVQNLSIHNRGQDYQGVTDRDRYRLTPAQRQVIHQALQADMERLQTVYGVDVGQWGFSLEAQATR